MCGHIHVPLPTPHNCRFYKIIHALAPAAIDYLYKTGARNIEACSQGGIPAIHYRFSFYGTDLCDIFQREAVVMLPAFTRGVLYVIYRVSKDPHLPSVDTYTTLKVRRGISKEQHA